MLLLPFARVSAKTRMRLDVSFSFYDSFFRLQSERSVLFDAVCHALGMHPLQNDDGGSIQCCHDQFCVLTWLDRNFIKILRLDKASQLIFRILMEA